MEDFINNGIYSPSDIEPDDCCDQSNNYDDVSAADDLDEHDYPELHSYSSKYLLYLLKQKYGEQIYVTDLLGRKNVVCFKNVASLII